MSASFLLLFNGKYVKRDYNYDSHYISTEYFSIHSTGGISGDYDETVKVYSEDEKYYLESTRDGCIKHELTKAEYMLCTSFYYPFLEEEQGMTGSDLIYQTITYKKRESEEVMLPKKSYQYIPGLIRFFERIKTTPDYELTKADQMVIDLSEYCQFNARCRCEFQSCQFLSGDDGDSHSLTHYYCDDYDDLVNFSTGCHEAFDSTASRIALSGALDKNNEEIAGLLEDYQQIRVGSQIMYYQVQTTEVYIYVGLVDLDTNSYYCAYVSNVEKARKKEPDDVYRHDRNERERIYDIIGLMTGRDLSKNKFYMAATIETLVFVSAIAVILAKGRKRSKKQSDGSDNQTT